MDAHLVELARAAEAGEECPPVRLIAGGSIIIGWPAPSSALAERSAAPLAAEYAVGLSGRSRRERRESPVDAETAAKQAIELLQEIGERAATDEPRALTLVGAQWLSPGDGGGLNLPVVRVPLASVAAWWIAGGEKLEARGWGGFVGFITPTG